MEEKKSVYSVLSSVNVNEHTETKNGLTYLSWAWAWGFLKEHYPNSTYTIYENRDELNYFTDGKTAWVKTGVTVEGIEYIEYLPIMDYKNKSIPVDNITSMDVNKTIQRSLTKCVARHGLGLYVYAGEDLPLEVSQPAPIKGTSGTKAAATPAPKKEVVERLPLHVLVTSVGQKLKNMKTKTGNLAQYEAILKEVTGDTTFKCNAATEAEYGIVESIYNKLNALGY